MSLKPGALPTLAPQRAGLGARRYPGRVTGVRICGDGIAARCAAYLLTRYGFAVRTEPGSRPRVPCLLLSHSAQELLQDVHQSNQVFSQAPQIWKRTVEWGENADPVTLPHSAVVLSDESLLSALPAVGSVGPAEVEWTIITTPSSQMHSFGGRMATVSRVQTPVESGECRIKSLKAGWEFLISTSDGSGWRIAAGDGEGEFPVAPRIGGGLCGPGWLACGSGALGFDPLCGDGTAHAIREAILATAVIRAATRGEDRDSLLEHYRARLTIGFRRHLEICRQFYVSGGAGPWWREQCAELDRGLEWCDDRLRGAPAFRYRLEGFELVP